MKRSASLLIVFACAVLAFGQKGAPAKGPDFDVADFDKKATIAEWLVRYDEMAWKSTDLVIKQDKKDLERLGADWFCFQDSKGGWHAVYGKLENDKYDQVFHFVTDPAGKITLSQDKVEQTFLVSHAKALVTARAKQQSAIPADSPAHNQYIQKNADGTFSVWILPAFQRNGLAVYGGEFIYTVDASGAKITKDESYFQGNFRGFKADPPREIWLAYPEKDKPTLGAIFFVLYYKNYFTSIFIENSKSTSTLSKAGGEFVWLHVEKAAKPAK